MITRLAELLVRLFNRRRLNYRLQHATRLGAYLADYNSPLKRARERKLYVHGIK